MRISVPPRFRRTFWRYAPVAQICWLWKPRPPIEPGDEILFTMNRKVVATAVCAWVEKHRGKWWRIWWHADSFEDVRDDDAEGFQPNLYGGYSGRVPEEREA